MKLGKCVDLCWTFISLLSWLSEGWGLEEMLSDNVVTKCIYIMSCFLFQHLLSLIKNWEINEVLHLCHLFKADRKEKRKAVFFPNKLYIALSLKIFSLLNVVKSEGRSKGNKKRIWCIIIYPRAEIKFNNLELRNIWHYNIRLSNPLLYSF